MLGNSTESDVDNDTSDLCVIVALSKAHSSGETSILYGQKLNKDDFGGEGHPFQLTQRNSLYIWENKTFNRGKDTIRVRRKICESWECFRLSRQH